MASENGQSAPARSGLLARLGRFCFRHRWWVLAAWLVGFVFFAMLSGAVGTNYSNNFTLPGTESQRAYDLLKTKFPAQAGDEDTISYKSTGGPLTAPALKRKIEANLAQIAKDEEIGQVISPFSSQGAGQISKDGKIAYATILFKKRAQDLKDDTAKPIVKQAKSISDPTLQVALGGWAIQKSEQTGPGATSLIGIIAALFILIITFGSLVAAGMPIITAIISLGIGLFLLALGSNAYDTPDWASQLAEMVGLGVGIDYALFIVTRFRAEIKNGADREQAAVIAMDTAGRAVFFAGITVMIALLGMSLLGLSFLQGVAISTSITVLVVLIASLTLLPAFLRIFGRKIDSLRVPFFGRGNRTEARWERWSSFIQRHPWAAVVVAVVILLALAVPALNARLASSDAGNNAPSTTTRQNYDILAEGFGAGFNGPLTLAIELPQSGGKAALAKIGSDLKGQDGVAFVSPPRINPNGSAATIAVQPTSSPQSQKTEDLLATLRNDVVPDIEEQTGTQIYIGGNTAGGVDFSQVLADKLPLFIGAVVLFSCLLLMIVFRSIVVPIKAAIMNLLSIGAALGLVTWVFQEGVGASLLGVESTGPIEAFVPVMMFAIVFGLSMDYEVFLMSRIHEEWMITKDASYAARHGLAVTGRVITAAAAIMVFVFASFILGDDRVIKMFGLGLASAVLIDAVIIRCLLVPALMQLFGKNAWWLPAWLDRLLPKLSLESQEELESAAAAGRDTGHEPATAGASSS